MRFLLLFSMVGLAACGDDDGDTTISIDGYRLGAAQFSPAGDQLAIVGEKDDVYALLITDDQGKGAQVLDESLSYLSTIQWMPDGQSVIYTAGSGFDDSGIYKVDVNGGAAPAFLVDAFAAVNIGLSPDGKTVAYSINGGAEISTADLSTYASMPVPAVSTGTSGRAPQYSPDGSQVLFIVAETYQTAAADFTNAQDGPAGAGYLSNGVWMNNASFMYLGDDAINVWKAGKASSVREAFAGMNLAYNAATSRYIYGINGSPDLTIGTY